MLRVLLSSIDQRCLVPFVLPEMEFSVGLVPILAALQESLGLGFLAGLHSFRHDIGEAALADHLQNVLAVEFPIYQYVIDMDQFLGRIK
ncbi:hypothetical protein GCM10009006_36270 [Haloarcula argentinensis]|uniref:Uncharacterized protein n=1 Tax=Haloarcula argentinensis TaxID=43776 RepID=A0A830FX59_HALAR|nr:hypothetical protein GCM10009006_36270 [Haloarcula argentinensis]